MIGGLVDEFFKTLFTRDSLGGFHNRMVFGLCPKDFQYYYMPLENFLECRQVTKVRVSRDVYAEMNGYTRAHSDLKADDHMDGRVMEMGLRHLRICASFGGPQLLKPVHLGPAIAFANYQMAVRKVLVPNRGITQRRHVYQRHHQPREKLGR